MNMYSHVFMVTGRHTPNGGIIETFEVLGSAFAIAQDTFITAGHVLNAAIETGDAGLSLGTDGKWIKFAIEEHEIESKLDLGIFRAHTFTSLDLIKWDIAPEGLLHKVCAVGYPWAQNPKRKQLSIRAFSGETVTTCDYDHGDINARVIELPFICPRGMSGGPLLTRKKSVIGIVIGNRQTGVEVFRSEEELGHSTHILTEYLHLGIALTSTAIFEYESRIMKGKLGKMVPRS